MILMKDIIKEGHPTLTKKALPVALPLSSNDKKTLKSMLEYIKNSQDETLSKKYHLRPAVGIAAPQINISKRMFAIHFEDFDHTLYSYMVVNPEITEKSNAIIYLPGGEGCLSVDRITEGVTPRYQSITLKGLHYDAKTDRLLPLELKLEGYVAIVFQHEFDHIEGIMFTSKLFKSLPFAKPAFEVATEEV